MLKIIDRTDNLSLDLSDKGSYIIHIIYPDIVEPIAVLAPGIFKIVDNNLQNCITSWSLYKEFIKLVDEAIDLLEEENK